MKKWTLVMAPVGDWAVAANAMVENGDLVAPLAGAERDTTKLEFWANMANGPAVACWLLLSVIVTKRFCGPAGTEPEIVPLKLVTPEPSGMVARRFVPLKS